MSGSAIIVIIIAVVIVAVIALGAKKEKSTLTSSGKIHEQEPDFYKKEHTFTTSASFDQIVDNLKGAGLAESKISMQADRQHQTVAFDGGAMFPYRAALQYKGEQNGKKVFLFSFLTWKERNGVPDYMNMNILLTAVEKSIYAADPSALVSSVRMQIRTK